MHDGYKDFVDSIMLFKRLEHDGMAVRLLYLAVSNFVIPVQLRVLEFVFSAATTVCREEKIESWITF